MTRYSISDLVIVFILFFLFVMEKLGEEGSVNLHCALRAELLATEASYAGGSVYYRLAVFDNDSLCRTYSRAYSAAYTQVFF